MLVYQRVTSIWSHDPRLPGRRDACCWWPLPPQTYSQVRASWRSQKAGGFTERKHGDNHGDLLSKHMWTWGLKGNFMGNRALTILILGGTTWVEFNSGYKSWAKIQWKPDSKHAEVPVSQKYHPPINSDPETNCHWEVTLAATANRNPGDILISYPW